MAVNSADRRELVINALLRTTSIEAAARMSGISNRTIHRYLGDPKFLEQYQSQKRKLYNDAVNRLLVNALDFSTTLHTIAIDSIAPPSARVAASRSALQLLKEHVLLETVEERVTKLEQAQEGRHEIPGIDQET